MVIEKISLPLEAINDFLTFSFLVSNNCNNDKCLVHKSPNSLQQNIGREENKDLKVDIFIKHCKKNISVFFTLENNYTCR